MKILCLCSAGTSRSGGTRLVLAGRGHEAIQAGVDALSIETIEYLAKWADKILVAEPVMVMRLSLEAQQKVDDRFTLGGDIWGNPLSPDLHAKVIEQLEKMEL